MQRTQRVLRLAALAMVVSAAILTPASAAQAGPPPPYGCSAFTEPEAFSREAAMATCQYGSGFFRALAYCESSWGNQVRTFYGPWRSPGNWSVALCSSSYPYAVGAGYETQAL